ncbi:MULTISPECIES: flagellar motor stator protein MotA [Stutzerimonas]|jgi:chemotaxis protein MotA|uniref:Flagellar motor stator protein MotA n=1 Tax=Stutzerimonas balearica TaxID=74829 RepID=A0A9X7UZN8_9GAMM|nr:flagellar motor stator protein MotA [Stutzerimonas balearica]KIL03994.1 flagellar motor protein MotA [Stutzerimonas stutzeri]MBB59805.1 flagellar motor stator protein MotA [Pseudomonas sp.]MBZ5757350.1 flagellar motor stator protein MotA [Pseudomonas sp. S5(2021)]WIX02433.1 flagellar motor stator protein MotA [Pseudomonas sp. AR5]MBD3736289.1 flagellar motor stator protein MotA [Stutzerimonas balearica]|tara:strand:- start:912 stop:1763 length:852 start_codon:yes stop_codon:yes gene_type:complete
MVKIIGILVVLGSVFGGFLLSGGKLAALIHPFEVMIIGGAALGGFLQANPGSTTKIVFQKSLKMFGNRFTHAFYLEVLGLLYAVLNKSRREGMMAIEADLEDPAASAVFSKYPGVLKDERMTAFICDYLRIMSSGNMAPHELEGLFDMELASLKEELEHPSHAVSKVADGLPAMGIVAAVLGIVITMSILADATNAEIGEKVATALVGTFLGILASYGFFGPLSGALEHDAKEELNLYEAIKATLVASASGMPPSLAAEFGRKVLFQAHRPSFSELEQAMRGS